MNGCRLGLGLLVTLASLLLLGTALATVHWVDFIVNQDALIDVSGNPLTGLVSSSILYNTRYRGLFQTCFAVDNSSSPLMQAIGAQDGCIIDPGITNFTTGNEEYDRRNVLLGASIILFFVSVFLIVVGLAVEIIGQCGNSFTKVRAAAIIIFIAALCNLAAMALFTTIKLIEDKQLDCCGFPASWAEDLLINNTEVKFYYSYFLGWISAGIGLIAPIMFCHAAGEDEDERVDWNKSHDRDNRGYGVDEHMANIPTMTKRDSHSKKKKLDYGVNEPQKVDSIYSWGYAGDTKQGSKKSHGSHHSSGRGNSSEKYMIDHDRIYT